MSSKSLSCTVAFSAAVWYNARMEMMRDAAMLLSFVNMKLRDAYASPEELCEDLGWDLGELEARLASAGAAYDASANRFR